MVNVAQIYKLQHGSDACYDEGGSGSIDRVPDQLPPLRSLVRGSGVVGVGSKVSELLEDVVSHHIHPEEAVEEKKLESKQLCHCRKWQSSKSFCVYCVVIFV